MRVAWRLTRTFLGYGFLALGVVGLFLPVLQGILFLAIGLSLLSADSPWARRYHDRLRGWMERRRALENNRGETDG